MSENYVPVVPDGQAAVHLSWKKWVFLQVHAGVFGAHRGAEQTVLLLERICVWEGMRADVPEWCNQCLTCIRFRKRPTKTEAVAVKPTHLECWEEVMIDCEGPSNPPDSAGHHYILSYLCLLSHGVLLEPIKQLTFSEVRRAFARCVFRSGTLPLLVRSDRGPESYQGVHVISRDSAEVRYTVAASRTSSCGTCSSGGSEEFRNFVP